MTVVVKIKDAPSVVQAVLDIPRPGIGLSSNLHTIAGVAMLSFVLRHHGTNRGIYS